MTGRSDLDMWESISTKHFKKSKLLTQCCEFISKIEHEYGLSYVFLDLDPKSNLSKDMQIRTNILPNEKNGEITPIIFMAP
jgi:hypothetical protein